MIKCNDVTLNINDYNNKGIIILVPRKEIRVKFRRGSTTIDMSNDGIGILYSKNEMLVGVGKRKHLGKPILSLNNVNNCDISFIPTNLKKYKIYITDRNKYSNMYKYLFKKLVRYYQ